MLISSERRTKDNAIFKFSLFTDSPPAQFGSLAARARQIPLSMLFGESQQAERLSLLEESTESVLSRPSYDYISWSGVCVCALCWAPLEWWITRDHSNGLRDSCQPNSRTSSAPNSGRFSTESASNPHWNSVTESTHWIRTESTQNT